MTNAFPVDLVVLWVDGNDLEFVRVRNKWAERLGLPIPPEARFVQSDELRYVLRGAELFLPWVTRIVLVTNGQCPAWLNICHPRLKILTHNEFMPSSCLPTFNAYAIEAGLVRWHDLSEHFLLANDDTFVFCPIPRSYFFPQKDLAVNYVTTFANKDYSSSLYGRRLLAAQMLLSQTFKDAHFPLEPHHNIHAYVKSGCLEAWRLFRPLLTATCASRFRAETDISRYVFAGVSAALGKAVWRYTRKSRWFGSDSLVWELWQDYARGIKKYRPRLVCLNDSEQCTKADREKLARYLQSMFPEKCSFEV
ncbi:MAG: stealth family protein [Elusimicrobia bacterium]|nr:stealth family protein [Elusimicrobiota bacterium]